MHITRRTLLGFVASLSALSLFKTSAHAQVISHTLPSSTPEPLGDGFYLFDGWVLHESDLGHTTNVSEAK